MRSRVATIDGGFALISHGRTLRLAGEQHGMNIGLYPGHDGVRDDQNKKRSDAGGIAIPLADEVAQSRIELAQCAAETHDELRSAEGQETEGQERCNN